MSKKGLGKFVAFAAVTGAVAAGVSYVLQYKTYHKELEKDFREFEDNEGETDTKASERTIDSRAADRSYISLSSSKDEFKVAARDMASATKNVLKDASSLLSDTAHEAVLAAVDTAHIAIHTMKAKKADFMEDSDRDKAEDSGLFEEDGFLDEDYVDEDDLYDYDRMEGGASYAPADHREDGSQKKAGETVTPSEQEEETPSAPKPTATIEDDTLD